MANDNELLYEINVNQNELKQQLNRVEKQFNNTFDDIDKKASNMNIMGSILSADAIKSGLSTAKDLIVNGLQKIVEETGQLEYATVQWEQLLGSAEKADKKIKDIFEFSNKTPFTFKEVEDATQQLFKLSGGALNTLEDIKLLGDASAKANVPINQLSETWGRLYAKINAGDKAFGDELNRLTDTGVISFEVKQKLQAMNSELLRTDGWKTLKEGAESATGSMEKSTKTIIGSLSTLKGTWDGIFAFDDANVQNSIKATIDTLIKSLNENKPKLQSMISDVFSVAGTFVNDWIAGALKIYDLFNKDKSYQSYEKEREFAKYAQKTQLSSLTEKSDIPILNEYLNKISKDNTKIADELRGAREGIKDKKIITASLTEGFKAWWDSSAINKSFLPTAFSNFASGSVNSYTLTGKETLQEAMAMNQVIESGFSTFGDENKKALERYITALKSQNTQIDKTNTIIQKRIELEKIETPPTKPPTKPKTETETIKKQYVEYVDFIQKQNKTLTTSTMNLYNSELNNFQKLINNFLTGTYQDIIKTKLDRSESFEAEPFYKSLEEKSPNVIKKAREYDEKFGGKEPAQEYKDFNKKLFRDENTYVDNVNNELYNKMLSLEGENDKISKLAKEFSVELKNTSNPLSTYYKTLQKFLFTKENNRIVNDNIKALNKSWKERFNLLKERLDKGIITQNEIITLKNKLAKKEITQEEYNKKYSKVLANRDKDGITQKEYDNQVELMSVERDIEFQIEEQIALNPVDINTKYNDLTNDISLTSAENAVNILKAMENFTNTTNEWANKNDIINSFVNPSISILSAWKNDSLNIFSKLSSTSNSLAGGISGLMNSGVIPKTVDIASLIGGLTGFGSIIGSIGSIFDLFSSGDEEEDKNYQTVGEVSTKRAEIVSSNAEIKVVNSFSINTSYIGDEVGTERFFVEQIAPRISDSIQGVL